MEKGGVPWRSLFMSDVCVVPPFPLPTQGRAVEITARVLKNSDLTLLVVDARWDEGGGEGESGGIL